MKYRQFIVQINDYGNGVLLAELLRVLKPYFQFVEVLPFKKNAESTTK